MKATEPHRLRRLTTAFAVLATIAVAVLGISPDDLRVAASIVSFWNLCALLAILLFTRVMQAMLLSVSLRSITGLTVAIGTSLDLMASKSFFNQLFGGAGVFAQALQARERLNITYQAFAAAAFWRIHSNLAVLAFGVLSVSPFLRAGHAGSLLTILATSMLLLLAGSVMLARRLDVDSPARRLQSKMPEVFRLAIRRRPTARDWTAMALLAALVTVSRLVRLAIITILLAPDMPLADLLLAFLVAEFAVLLPITPGGMGIRELVLAAVGGVSGRFDTLLLAGIADRLVVMLFNFGHAAFVGFSARRRARPPR